MRHLLENGRIEKIADDSDEIRQSHKRGQIVTLAVINADVHVFLHLSWWLLKTWKVD